MGNNSKTNQHLSKIDILNKKIKAELRKFRFWFLCLSLTSIYVIYLVVFQALVDNGITDWILAALTTAATLFVWKMIDGDLADEILECIDISAKAFINKTGTTIFSGTSILAWAVCLKFILSTTCSIWTSQIGGAEISPDVDVSDIEQLATNILNKHGEQTTAASEMVLSLKADWEKSKNEGHQIVEDAIKNHPNPDVVKGYRTGHAWVTGKGRFTEYKKGIQKAKQDSAAHVYNMYIAYQQGLKNNEDVINRKGLAVVDSTLLTLTALKEAQIKESEMIGKIATIFLILLDIYITIMCCASSYRIYIYKRQGATVIIVNLEHESIFVVINKFLATISKAVTTGFSAAVSKIDSMLEEKKTQWAPDGYFPYGYEPPILENPNIYEEQEQNNRSGNNPSEQNTAYLENNSEQPGTSKNKEGEIENKQPEALLPTDSEGEAPGTNPSDSEQSLNNPGQPRNNPSEQARTTQRNNIPSPKILIVDSTPKVKHIPTRGPNKGKVQELTLDKVRDNLGTYRSRFNAAKRRLEGGDATAQRTYNTNKENIELFEAYESSLVQTHNTLGIPT